MSDDELDRLRAEVEPLRQMADKAKAWAHVNGLFTGGYQMADDVALLDLISDTTRRVSEQCDELERMRPVIEAATVVVERFPTMHESQNNKQGDVQ